jgi:pimeloyl-ACP methyl ester carboxylesterase
MRSRCTPRRLLLKSKTRQSRDPLTPWRVADDPSCTFDSIRRSFIVASTSEMESHEDDELIKFEASGAAPLPVPQNQGHVDHSGARIWYATYGSGASMILLHGGLGHSGNWGYQIPALINHGYRAILIDSRGHGQSTRDERPFKYELMASDVLAVMDSLKVDKASIVGWSDGACTALILGMKVPERVTSVFFFVCNMDPSGTKDFEFGPLIRRCFNRHRQDYIQLSATPDQFGAFSDAVGEMMKTEPNYSAEQLANIRVPVAIVQSEHDEFIKPEHAEYLARIIPNAEFVRLEGVSHFAPLQRPEVFNNAMLAFLGKNLV